NVERANVLHGPASSVAIRTAHVGMVRYVVLQPARVKVELAQIDDTPAGFRAVEAAAIPHGDPANLNVGTFTHPKDIPVGVGRSIPCAVTAGEDLLNSGAIDIENSRLADADGAGIRQIFQAGFDGQDEIRTRPGSTVTIHDGGLLACPHDHEVDI